MTDVYDGNIWKDFNGRKYHFFNEERNYGVRLNIDWFQPFKYTNYSVGAIYMTILNLPIFFKQMSFLLGLSEI